MRREVLSVMASALGDDAREAPRRARLAGFAGLAFDAYANALDLTELSASGRREFKRLLAAEHQRLVALRCDLGPMGFGPGADVDRALARLDRALEAGAGLDATCVSIDLGPLPPAPVNPKPRPAITPQQAGLIILPGTQPAPATPAPPAPPPDPSFVAQTAAALAELGARADRYHMPLALSSSLASFASLHHAMLSVDCPWFGLELDPVAILRDEWDMDEVFSSLGSLVRHVRARDAVRGADRRTKPAVIGQGSVNWPALLGDLEDAGYSGAMTIDPVDLADRSAAAIAGLRFLRSL